MADTKNIYVWRVLLVLIVVHCRVIESWSIEGNHSSSLGARDLSYSQNVSETLLDGIYLF